MNSTIVKGTLAALAATAASIAFAAVPVADGAANDAARRVMFVSLLRMQLAGQVVGQAAKMGEGASSEARAEIVKAAEARRSRAYAMLKSELTAAFGAADKAEAGFTAFANAVTEAENSGDGAELAALAAAVGIEPVPENFTALRVQAMQNLLAAEMESSSIFLGDIQSWLRLKGKGETPPLSAWLSRELPSGTIAAPAAGTKKKSRGRSLRDAEPAAPEFHDTGDGGESPLASLKRQRAAKWDKAIQEGDKGFAQVAEERRLADAADNTKKLAAAEAEAAAQKAQAEKLAETEQEAITQDRESWKSRFKGIMFSAAATIGSSLIGSIDGNITSGIGGGLDMSAVKTTARSAATSALQEAVQAVFVE